MSCLPVRCAEIPCTTTLWISIPLGTYFNCNNVDELVEAEKALLQALDYRVSFTAEKLHSFRWKAEMVGDVVLKVVVSRGNA